MLTVEEFDKRHPWPDKNDIPSLYRYMPISDINIQYIEKLFLDKELYHSLASQFNDPFEGKPHFKLDGKVNNPKIIRNHVIKAIHKKKGTSYKEAENLFNAALKNNPNFIADTMKAANKSTFENLRICCFTTSNKNLLFWSHYANSHKGFCIGFDATVMPISMAYKVEYSSDYPQILYPMPRDQRAFRSALIKSEDWIYEDEYRSIFFPIGVDRRKLPHNGKSLLIDKNVIKNIYLGARISESDKDTLLAIINKSDFNPVIWQASLAENSYSLSFEKV